MRPFTYLAAALAATTAPGAALAQEQPPPLKVADVRAVVGDWIVLRAETEARVVRWRSLERGLRLAPPELALRDPRTALATAARPGKYRVVCVTARGDVPSEIVEFVVTVEPEGPEPPSPPTPPEPDQLARRVREALQADPAEADKKRDYTAALASFYRTMARRVAAESIATIGELLSEYRQAIPRVLPDDAIRQVRKICGDEVAAMAGDNPERSIDADLRHRLVELFTHIAKVLSPQS